MAVNSQIGGTLSFNTSLPTAEDASSYGALSSWSELENVIDAGAIQETSEDTTHVPLKSGFTQHTPGAKDIATVAVNASYDESDSTNMDTLLGYNNASTVLAFKYEDANGRVWYWKGRVANAGKNEASASGYEGRSFEIRNAGTALVEVAPA